MHLRSGRWLRVAAAILAASCSVPPGSAAEPTARPHALSATQHASASLVPASATAELPPTPPGPPACAESEQVRPSKSEDLAWIKHVADLIMKGADRRRVGCLFGVESGTNGSYVVLTPRASNVFETVLVDGTNPGFSTVVVQTTFRKDAQPPVAALQKAVGALKSVPVLHPHERGKASIAYLRSADDTSMRILVDYDFEDSTRVREVTIYWEDLRGYALDPSCDEHVQVTVDPPPPLGRLPAGEYAVRVSAGGKSFFTSCTVASSLLDASSCKPRVQEGLLAVVEAASRSLRISAFGHNDPVVVDVQRDGALYASKRLSPRYPTGNACNIAYETVTP